MSEEILTADQVLQVPFNYSAGPVASRFFLALRDEEKILGLRCASCGKVYVPPRAVCGPCFRAMEDWVEVGPGGELMNFTAVHYSEPVHPRKAPFIIGVVKLEGADTCLVHVVDAPGRDIRAGMRVKAVFAEERHGHLMDIEGFVPV